MASIESKFYKSAMQNLFLYCPPPPLPTAWDLGIGAWGLDLILPPYLDVYI